MYVLMVGMHARAYTRSGTHAYTYATLTYARLVPAAPTHTRRHARLHTHTHTRTHTRKHAHTHSRTHTHRHTHTHRRVRPPNPWRANFQYKLMTNCLLIIFKTIDDRAMKFCLQIDTGPTDLVQSLTNLQYLFMTNSWHRKCHVFVYKNK